MKNSHYVWNPNKSRKLRKLGHLVHSAKDTLNDMLDYHMDEVKTLLLDKKQQWEEMHGTSSRTDEEAQTLVTGLRSPPLPSGTHTPKPLSPGPRNNLNIVNPLRSPKMPALGMFGVTSPRSPRSPMKRPF